MRLRLCRLGDLIRFYISILSHQEWKNQNSKQLIKNIEKKKLILTKFLNKNM